MNSEISFEEGLLKVKELVFGTKKRPIFIGVAGASCSGKTTFANKLNYYVLSLDDYYFGKSKSTNFDIPTAIDFKLLNKNLNGFLKQEKIEKPIYDFYTHSRIGYEIVAPKKVIVLEGLYALHSELNKFIDIRVFISCDLNTCLNRRLIRDKLKRGRDSLQIIEQFNRQVVPAYKKYVLPTKKGSIIVNND